MAKCDTPAVVPARKFRASGVSVIVTVQEGNEVLFLFAIEVNSKNG
ncbi:MAG: hypothetical protein IJE43_01040 [Alphaproteobacteria bacterium]|nr:hypothetical protein [Alphaproteobacteria bacterium]